MTMPLASTRVQRSPARVTAPVPAVRAAPSARRRGAWRPTARGPPRASTLALPGPAVALTWRALAPLQANHKVFVHAVADFVNACVEGKPVAPTFEDGLRNQQVLEAVEQSANTGRWVKL